MADETPITPEEMRRYNKLIAFAKERGYAGNPKLDHDESLRKKVFTEFNEANPKDAIDISKVKPIQKEIQEYRAKTIEAIKAGKGQYGGDINKFMEGISQVDGIFGQKTSQWQFPEAYLLDKEKNQKTKLGFASKVDMEKISAAKTVEDFLRK